MIKTGFPACILFYQDRLSYKPSNAQAFTEMLLKIAIRVNKPIQSGVNTIDGMVFAISYIATGYYYA
jgi:hypothetical protein